MAAAHARLNPAGIQATAFAVSHSSGGFSLLACDGKIIAYTGDTEWVEALLTVGRGADLLIAEAYSYDRKVRFHLDFATLRQRLPTIGAKRLILTHMAPDMLMHARDLSGGIEAASDGMEVQID